MSRRFQLIFISKETLDTAREITKSRRGSKEWSERMNERERKREWKKERTDEGDKKARVRGRGEKMGAGGKEEGTFPPRRPP